MGLDGGASEHRLFKITDLYLTYWQAEVKIKSIYEAVRDSVPWDVTCIRTKHTVSIHCELLDVAHNNLLV